MKTERKTREPRKAFDVMIGETIYPVYDIDGKEHAGANGVPTTWWIYFTKTPVIEGTFPPLDSEHWVPYHSWVKRCVWEIEFKMRNTSKVKWDEVQFSYRVSTFIKCNGKPFYSFGSGGDMAFAMAKAQYLLTVLTEHSYNFLNPESERGRKIFWKGMPAFVHPRKSEPWCIDIEPDYSEHTIDEWWNELERRTIVQDDWDKDMFNDTKRECIGPDGSGRIRWGDAFSDQYIKWFRKS